MSSRNTDPALLPAHVMSDEIGVGRLSPVDIVDAALAKIGAQDQKLHAFVEVYDKEARLAADAAEKAIRSGHRIGPLHGIPIALKDLIEIEGISAESAKKAEPAPPLPQKRRPRRL